MKKDLENLNSIFNKKFFRIPDYQRGYSWGEKQLNDFWEDIELLSENEYHYTGLLTYEKINPQKLKGRDLKLKEKYSYDACYIIDGQQRLTTISILLKSILKHFDEEDLIIDEQKKDWVKKFLFKSIEGYEYFIFGYEKDNPSDYFFKTKILERNISDKEADQKTIYTSNLVYAKEYFEKKLEVLSKSKLKTIFGKIINQLKFNLYEVDSDLEVFVVFETMNNRGKNLSKLELLKNRLIYLSTKTKEDINKEDLRDQINDSWKTIYNYLGRNTDNVLNDDDYLKYHWIRYFSGYNRNEANVFSEFLLTKHFTVKNILSKTLSAQKIKEYTEDLQLSVQNYFFIENPTFNTEKKQKYQKSVVYLEKLNRLGFSSFIPLVISLLNKDVEDEQLEDILKSIERFIFVVFKISRYFSTYKNTDFYKLANEFKEGKFNASDLSNQIDRMTKDNTYIDSFKSYINERFQGKKKGYYDWPTLKYFLFEYELSLKNKKGINEDKLIWNNFIETKKDHASIEHIFPQSKAKNVNQKIQCHSLGNLVSLSNEINSKLQDGDFKEKKKRYKDGSLSEREVFDYYGNWTQEEIKQRGLKLLNFMEDRWNLDLKDESYKLELLGLKE
jgi:uncharacterized protein with ParB-like and HNH nuclease domain